MRDEATPFHDVFDGVRLGSDRFGSQGETSSASAPREREQRAAACREQQHAGTAHLMQNRSLRVAGLHYIDASSSFCSDSGIRSTPALELVARAKGCLVSYTASTRSLIARERGKNGPESAS